MLIIMRRMMRMMIIIKISINAVRRTSRLGRSHITDLYYNDK